MRKLKRGIALFHTTHTDEYLLGTYKRALRIYTPEERALAEDLMRGVEDAGSLSPLPDNLHRERLWNRLEESSLIDRRESSVKVSKRFTSKIAEKAIKNSQHNLDAGYLQMQERLAPEVAQTTWIDGVDDAGIEIVSARQNYIVELSGKGRVLTLLFPLLIASGVTQVRFTSASRGHSPLIGNTDVGISHITQSDIGSGFRQHFESTRHELALFPLDKDIDYSEESTSADIKVHFGEIDPEALALWMSSGQVFLPIAAPLADRVSVGPLVIPGKSPCMRCHQLLVADQIGITEVQRIDKNETSETPIVASHMIAALAASQILHYLDSLTLTTKTINASQIIEREKAPQAELVGNVIHVDYQSLLRPHIVALTRHPLCGCAF